MKKIFVYFVAIGCLVFIGLKIYLLIKIDQCLDQGNVWDYKKNSCITQNLTQEMAKCYSQHGSWNSRLKVCE